MAKHTKAEIEESKTYLREYLNPLNVRRIDGHDKQAEQFWIGETSIDRYEVRKHLPTLYFVIDSVARSGMSRKMRVYVGHPT